MLACYSVWTCIPRLASMDFRQIRTFRCVAELGSLSKAADKLRIAQPALSRQIKLLEHELRTDLFTRSGRGMVLTEAGRILLARTAGIVRQIDQIRDDIQSAAGAPSGRVVLGLVPTVSCVLSARLARRTVETYPGISLCIVESYSGHLIEWLHRGEMDLAIIYGPSADLHLNLQHLGRDQIVAVGPRGSGLARKKQVAMDWLLRQKLVLPSHSHGLRALIEKAAAKKKLQLDVQIEADSFRVLTSLVEMGLGYALLPPSSIRDEVRERRLETATITGQVPMRELLIASPIDHPDSTATGVITALLRDETSACRDEGWWDIKLA
jgi:LysR family transcriptional regulator, nitrogen assimilation regulatory protein